MSLWRKEQTGRRAAALVGIAGVLSAVGCGDEPREPLRPDAPSNPQAAVAAGPDGVWVGNADGTVQRADPATGRLEPPLSTAGRARVRDMAIGDGSVWVLLGNRTVARFDARRGRLAERIRIPFGATAIAWSRGGVWVAGARAAVRIDPRARRAERPRRTGRLRDDVAIDGDVVYLPSEQRGILRIDARTGAQVAPPLRAALSAGPLAVHDGVAWAVDALGSPMHPIDVRTDRRREPLALEDTDGREVVAGPDGAFVLAKDGVVRYDVRSGERVENIAHRYPDQAEDIALHGGVLWVAGDGDGGLRRIEVR